MPKDSIDEVSTKILDYFLLYIQDIELNFLRAKITIKGLSVEKKRYRYRHFKYIFVKPKFFKISKMSLIQCIFLTQRMINLSFRKNNIYQCIICIVKLILQVSGRMFISTIILRTK